MAKIDIVNANIDLAIFSYERCHDRTLLNVCVREFGTPYVWKYAGDKLRQLQLTEDDLEISDKTFIIEDWNK